METQSSNLKSQNHSSKVKNELRHRVYKFSIDIIKFLGPFFEKRSTSSVADQLLRSATSIGANIIEAKSASSKKDFIKYYDISLKSANETKYWICLLRDGYNIKDERLTILLREAEEISNIIASSLLTLKNKK